MDILKNTSQNHIPWNKGKLIGQKPALKIKEIWAIRIRLQSSNCIFRPNVNTHSGLT